MAPTASSDAYKHNVAVLRRDARMVRQALLFLSVLIFFNLVFLFRAIYFFHQPLDLIPFSSHPRYDPIIDLETIETNSQDLVLRSEVSTALSVIDERATPGWSTIALAGFWVAKEALSWYGIVMACQDFSGPGAQFSCVMGAIATVAAYAGTVIKSYQWTGSLVNIYVDPGWKRDLVPVIDGLSTTLNTTVWHAGVYTPPALPSGSLISNVTGTGPRHVFGFTGPHGGDMHVTYMGNHSETGQHWVRFGFGNGLGQSNSTSNGTASKRESYQSQHFTGGGIDLISEWIGEGSQIDPANDYIHIYNQIKCQFSGFNGIQEGAAGSYFQIYDNIKRGTIAAGAIAPFAASDHWSAIANMWKVPTPIEQRFGCSSIE